MIRISKVQALGAKEARYLQLAAREYRDDLAGRSAFDTHLQAALAERQHVVVGVKRDEWLFLDWVRRKYQSIIIGHPANLASLINEVATNDWARLFHDGERRTQFGSNVEAIFGYGEDWFKPVRKRLAERLNIKTCPYCNAQYTLVLTDTNDALVVKLQFDHFFPKNRYPWLCVSFYNLIPVCANCNSAKSAEVTTLNTHYHPYHSALADWSRYDIKGPDGNLLSTLPEMQRLTPGDLTVSFVSRSPDKDHVIRRHNEVFDITGVYQRHTDVAHELLEKAVLYNKHYRSSLEKIEGLFPDRKVMMRYILGNYVEEDRMLERPLAKFTQDLAKRLKLLDEV